MFNIIVTFILLYLSRLTTKSTKWHVRPANTQMNMGNRPVWSESSLRSLAIIRAHSKASVQTGRISRLIWVFAGRKGHFVGFVIRRLILLCLTCVNNTDFCYFETFYFLKLPEKARVSMYLCTCMLVSVYCCCCFFSWGGSFYFVSLASAILVSVISRRFISWNSPRKRGFLCINARVCLSPFIMSYCRQVVILTFIFHDGRRVSLFI